MKENIDQLKAFLLRAGSYPAGETASVELVETHISLVFLGDRFVYKLKKPVKFEFLDFSTLDARRRACDDELRLNRRMAAGAYLGVVPIVRDSGGELRFGAPRESATDPADSGEIVDWVVKMRRLDGGRMLDELIRNDRLTADDIARLAGYLADYYAAAPSAVIEPGAYHASIVRHVRANRDDLLRAAATDLQPMIRRIHGDQLRFLHEYRGWFEERVRIGKIVDGHGDLRPEHICLETIPAVYDCVEFSAEFRRIDVADELSFLAVECDVLGRPDVGEAVIEKYRWTCDVDLDDLLIAFYKSYRACVRGKVAVLRAEQQAGAERERSVATVAGYLKAAARFNPECGWTLFVMRGLMGTGKSTLAAALAEELAIQRIRTDEVRLEMFGAARDAAAFGAAHYSAENKAAVYDETLRRCTQAISAGESVVADGSFLDADSLLSAAEAARSTGAQLLVVECRCPAEEAKSRIARRLAEGRDPSEARPELYDRQAAAAQSIPAGLAAIVVDTVRPLTEQIAAVFSRSFDQEPNRAS